MASAHRHRVPRPSASLALLVGLVAIVGACTGDRSGAPSPAPSSGSGSASPSASVLPSSSVLPSARVSPSRPRPTAGPVGVACLDADERSRVVNFDSESGVPLGGVILGDGSTGVVLAHETRGSVCQWLPFGRWLADRGYRVLLFDFNGYGASPASPTSPGRPYWELDVRAAAGELRREGIDHLVLGGANIGGIAALAAAADLDPPPDAVIDISGMLEMTTMNGPASAARLTVPILYVASTSDEYRSQVETTLAATPAGLGQLELVDATSHGLFLLDSVYNPHATELARTIERFIREHTDGAGRRRRAQELVSLIWVTVQSAHELQRRRRVL